MTGNQAYSIAPNLISKLPLCEGRCRNYVSRLLVAYLLILPFSEYYRQQFNVAHWDLLLFTGVAAFLLGIRLYAVVRERFELTIERLLSRGIFKVDEAERAAFSGRLEMRGRAWSVIGGVITAIAMFTAFAIALSHEFHFSRLLLGLAEVVGAYIAGTYLGRMASYGQLGWHLKSEPVEVLVQPSHVDGVAGMKPLGDFYFYQAMVVGIPAVFLAVWWFLFPIWPVNYSHWEDPYAFLLGFTIALEALAFLAPIWAFHRIMLRSKAGWLEEADRLSLDIAELYRRRESARDAESKEILTLEIDEKSQHYWAIENMPTWPVDVRTSRRFRINNILLLVPLLGDIAGRTVKWQDIIDLINKLG
jgi:hypothetical protein